MNKKALLLTIFAATFSGMNLVASEEVSVETTIVKIKTFKAIADKQIRRHCREVNSDLCQALELLMATTDAIDLEKANDILSTLRAELNNLSNPTTILEDAAPKTEEVTTEVCTALMVIPQDQN